MKKGVILKLKQQHWEGKGGEVHYLEVKYTLVCHYLKVEIQCVFHISGVREGDSLASDAFPAA
jgi:hypothetical protein